jgi:hypothetical protein
MTAYMDTTQTDAVLPRARPARLAAAGFGAAFAAAGLLWWRFGEGVYTTSLISAIMACF